MAGQEESAHPEFWERHHFWIRRLHSLMGVIPLGVFLVMHLMANASILGGAEVFNESLVFSASGVVAMLAYRFLQLRLFAGS